MQAMAHAELVQPAENATPPWWKAMVAFGGLGFVLAVGLVLGGEGGTFASTGLSFFPLLVLAILLQLHEWPIARVLSWIWFWITMTAFAGTALALTALSVLAPELPPIERMAEQVTPVALAMFAILVLGAFLAATPLWASLATRLGARIDRHSPAHAQGTVGVLLLSGLAIAPLVLLGGRAPLTDLLNRIDGVVQSLSTAQQLLAQVYSVVWIGVLVIFGCGWPVRATFRDTLSRLGLGPMQRRDVALLAGVTVATVGVGIALDFLNRGLMGWLGLPMTDPTVVTRLVPAAATPLGALVIAACAGVSEELMFRGWLQPCLGWLLANIGFVAAHAFQYGLDGLVAVFVLGAIMAFVRWRWNTTASIGVHFAYDAVLFLLSAFGF